MSTQHLSLKLLILVMITAWLGIHSTPAYTNPPIFFDRLSTEQGLSQSNVYSIKEDPSGFLWFATEAAVDRFDGLNIRSFRHDPADPNTITAGPVNSLKMLPNGELWILTEYGVSRLDTQTFEVTRVLDIEPIRSAPMTAAPGKLASLCEKDILVLSLERIWRINPETLNSEPMGLAGPQPQARLSPPFEDSKGRLWITDGHSLWRADCDGDEFKHQASQLGPENSLWFGLSVVTETRQGHIAWAGPNGVTLLDADSSQQFTKLQPVDHGYSTNEVLALATDPIGGLWLLTKQALVRVELNESGSNVTRWTTHLTHTLDPLVQDRNPMMQIAQSGDGLIWVTVNRLFGTYYPREDVFRAHSPDPTNPHSLPALSGELGYELYTDRFGVLWIGAKLGGIGRYVPQRHRFEHFYDDSQVPYVVRGIAEQRVNNEKFLWVGLDDAGIQLWARPANGRATQLPTRLTGQHQNVDVTQLRVRGMATHPQTGEVWFLTRQWFGRADATDQTIELLQQQIPERDRSRALAFSPDGRYLYQTDGWTIIEHQFDPRGQLVESRRFDWLEETIAGLRTSAVAPMVNGAVLLSAEDKVFVVYPQSQTTQELIITSLSGQPSNARVISISPIDQNRVLLGTFDHGLKEVQLHNISQQPSAQVVKQWSESNGLPDVTIYAIARDLSGRIWVSSNRGLSRIDRNGSEVLNFGLSDGLQGLEFNTRVVHQTNWGEIYFGGINGISVFSPRLIEPHPLPPIVSLTQATINQQAVLETDLDRLRHDQNNWVFEYVGLHSVAPVNNRFSFKLAGLDQDWIDAGSQKVARYTGLMPGQYRFWVRSANSDGLWSEPKLLFQATIKPPPWASAYAYMLYAGLALVLILAASARARYRRIQLQQLVEQRTQELKQKTELVTKQSHALQDALNARTLFFANVSHELRTPLTLIEANLSDIEKDLPKNTSIEIARRYLKRLVDLVDQLLDLSKIRIAGVQTQTNPWSINDLVETTLQAYESIAGAKGIQLIHHSQSAWQTRADPSAVEKILLNLLTNAIKFTPNKGRVEILLDPNPEGGLWLRVRDTGPGIPESEQAAIFERFHRVPIQEAQRISGAGIGLTLVSEAVAAIGGTIELDSTVGQGSTFSVWLPAEPLRDTRAAAIGPASDIQPLNTNSDLTEPTKDRQNTDQAGTKPAASALGRLLVVEDNADLLAYLDKQLSNQWSVVSARDGQEALHQLKHHEVDLILSDIMMPNMDGLALLEHVRNDLATSHIPFLFLTARSDDETELQSLMLSADDFLRKPFDVRILELKLENLMEARRRLQVHMEHGQPDDAPSHGPQAPKLSPRDHRFIERLMNQLQMHYTDPELTVAGLATSLAVDERTLQRKISALYGQTPVFFINEYRIKKACELLQDPSIEIQEVAYQCGYTTPRYFSRVFQKHRRKTPSAWRAALFS